MGNNKKNGINIFAVAVVALACIAAFGYIFFTDPINRNIEFSLKVKVFIFFISLYGVIVLVLFLWLFGPSLLRMSALNSIGEQVLGRKHAHLIGECVDDYRMLSKNILCGLVENLVFAKFFNPIKYFAVGRLRLLWEKNRKAALEEIYNILCKGGNKVPADAWEEFFRRNPEACELKRRNISQKKRQSGEGIISS